MRAVQSDPVDRFAALFGTGFGLLAWLVGGGGTLLGLAVLGNMALALLTLILLPRLRHHRVAWVGALGTAFPLLLFYLFYLEAGLALDAGQPQWRDADIVAFERGVSAAIPTLKVPFVGPLAALAYVGYIPFLALGVAALFTAERRGPESPAQRMVRAIVVVWGVCFVLYLIYPVLGPRLVEPAIHEARLGEGVVTQLAVLHKDRTMLRGGAFPSAHLAATVITMLALLRWRRKLAWLLMPGAVGIAFAAAYLEYHYLTDLAVGGLLGALVFWGDGALLRRSPDLARALRSRRAKPWFAVAGVAVSTLLVLVLAGALHGVRNAMGSYAGQPGVDLWVAPPGADNLIRGSFAAQIHLDYVDSLRAVPGVDRVDPMVKAFLTIEPLGPDRKSRMLTLLAIGYQVPDGLGGPPAFAEGRPPRGRREVALDRAAGFRLGVGTGDTIVLGGRKVAVSGLTRGTNMVATQFLFADFAAALRLAGSGGGASFLLVRLAHGTSPPSMAAALEQRFPDLRVFPRAAFLGANLREVSAGFLPLLGLIGLLGLAACAVLVGLLVHAVAEERRADIAVLLALGAGVRTVGAGVMEHALTLALLGVATGSALAWGLAGALDRFLPTVPLAIAPRDAGLVAILFVVVSLVSALAPVLQLGRIDPLEAFRP